MQYIAITHIKVVRKVVCNVGTNIERILDTFFLIWRRVNPAKTEYAKFVLVSKKTSLFRID
jgi:hypothetical protein